MKKFFIITITFILATLAKADCLEYGTHCWWPSGKIIGNASIIIINTSDLDFASGLTTNYPIYLQSIKTKIKIQLLISNICNSGLNLTQIILSPSNQLIEGQEYELFVANSSKKA